MNVERTARQVIRRTEAERGALGYPESTAKQEGSRGQVPEAAAAGAPLGRGGHGHEELSRLHVLFGSA